MGFRFGTSKSWIFWQLHPNHIRNFSLNTSCHWPILQDWTFCSFTRSAICCSTCHSFLQPHFPPAWIAPTHSFWLWGSIHFQVLGCIVLPVANWIGLFFCLPSLHANSLKTITIESLLGPCPSSLSMVSMNFLIFNCFAHKPLSLSLVSGPEVFKIKEILEAKCSGEKFYYLIAWKGFCPDKGPGNQLRKLMPINSSASFIIA